MSTLLKMDLSGYDVKPNVNISYRIHFFFEEKYLEALDTYAKKINPPSIVFGVRGGGYSVWSADS